MNKTPVLVWWMRYFF